MQSVHLNEVNHIKIKKRSNMKEAHVLSHEITKNMGSEARLCHIQGVESWADHLISLYIHFLIYGIGIIIVLSS